MKDRPFFSVIVPEHNSADFMRKGLDSIKAQTFTDTTDEKATIRFRKRGMYG